MKINLDKQLNINLRDKINEMGNFSFNKTAEFKFPSGGKGSKRQENAFNCICAALDRIDDLVEHCNELDLTQTKEGIFALCDLFNYGQTLIDCIAMIGDVYGIKYDSTNDISSFQRKGSDGKGNDEKYFKYLRSLCSVHPLETNMYKEYQGDQPEWCPYINTGKSPAIQLLAIQNDAFKKADFIVCVYRNDMDFSKNITIEVEQIFHYIKKRYEFINKIIKAIDGYNNNQIQQLKDKHILLPPECATYDDYLKNIEDEINIRYGSDYEARVWRAIFKTHFADESHERALLVYKNALRKGIAEVHNRLQALDFLDNDWTCDAIEDSNIVVLKEFPYEMEKLTYLAPSYAIEDRENEDFSFIDEPTTIDCLRMRAILDAVECVQRNGATHNDLKDVGRYLDNKYSTTNSEWARIQLKIMEPVIGKYFSFDYYSNDWHLYLQTKIAKWLLLQDKEI